jgi:hypothetical protein
MAVERNVRSIERDVMFDECADPAGVTPDDALEPRPEESMMDQQEVGTEGSGAINSCLARIHRDGHSLDRPGVLDLQSVQGAPIICNACDVQVFIEILGQRGEWDHGLYEVDRNETLSRE